jgi:uncharacterized repeat protein (TIGR03806 family)
MIARALVGTLALAALACGEAAPTDPHDALSTYDLLDNDGGRLTTRPGVTPYDLRNELFSDHATKARAVRIPSPARYEAQGAFDFPVGTLATKSFGYPTPDGGTRWIETRVLVHEADGWHGYAYAWDSAQRDARRLRDGAEVALDLPGAPARHTIPPEAACTSCHGAEMKPIGLRAVELNRRVMYADGEEEQLTRWSRQGLVAGAPALADVPRAAAWNDPATGTTAARARAYLDANCAHCHSQAGLARATGLFLDLAAPDPGRCAPSGVPSTPYVIAPGDPDHSYLVKRVESATPGEMMPPLGRALVDAEGAALLRAWIGETRGACAN